MRRVPADWPTELKNPISLDNLQRTISRQQTPKNFSIDLLNAIAEERYRRIEALAAFLSRYDFGDLGPTVSRQFPSDEDDWTNLVSALCECLDIPALRIVTANGQRPGAKRKWTDKQYCMLFADVQSLVSRGMSASAACAHIARNGQLFESRYLRPNRSSKEGWKKTLHRQFLNAQREIRDNPAFRTRHFSQVEWGPPLIAEAIQRYGAQTADQMISHNKATRI
ncbi:hypothetical protein U7859_02235 [Bradyrhizobium ottawaense]|uniref:hypothetical protein n=1 Tax=Bradyrhizobium ottawaense TaxID=931866 RepID=UPI002ADFBE51|nr:hypothetical protein [Bradyrhizobium ottawaense]WQN83322.1 hypothetical protein U7859_02235 [Bradyrhizobium ottawaense]